MFAAGLLPLPEKAPLNTQLGNRLERDGYTIQKVVFQSLPNFFVGGSLYRPIDPNLIVTREYWHLMVTLISEGLMRAMQHHIKQED